MWRCMPENFLKKNVIAGALVMWEWRVGERIEVRIMML